MKWKLWYSNSQGVSAINKHPLTPRLPLFTSFIWRCGIIAFENTRYSLILTSALIIFKIRSPFAYHYHWSHTKICRLAIVFSRKGWLILSALSPAVSVSVPCWLWESPPPQFQKENTPGDSKTSSPASNALRNRQYQALYLQITHHVRIGFSPALLWPMGASTMKNMFFIIVVAFSHGSFQPHVAIEHMKCD